MFFSKKERVLMGRFFLVSMSRRDSPIAGMEGKLMFALSGSKKKLMFYEFLAINNKIIGFWYDLRNKIGKFPS